MFISAIINLAVSRQLYKVARKTESIALEADALHLKTDVYTSAGVGIGLILMWITGYMLLDPLIAIVVAIFILKESLHLLGRAYSPLLDSALPKEDIKEIKVLLKEMNIQYHELKTRKAGSHKFLDFHVEMPSEMELRQLHRICDDIEKKLEEHIPQLTVNIHVEPIEKNS
jgi:cation diffusion facilitator family transporter